MTKPSKLLQWLHMSPLSMRGAPPWSPSQVWGQVRPGEAIMEGLGERWWKVCPLRCTEVQTKSFQIDVDWQVFPATIKLGTRWCHPVVIRLVHTHLTTDTTCYNHHKPEFYNLYSDKPVRFLTCYFSDLSSSIRIHSYPFHYGNLEQPQLFFNPGFHGSIFVKTDGLVSRNWTNILLSSFTTQLPTGPVKGWCWMFYHVLPIKNCHFP